MAYGAGYAGGYTDITGLVRTVEIEFDPDVWTDVTEDVVSIATRRGRNRELGAFETGTLSMVLRNDDRTYDPDNSAGPYYGKLRPNRRVRFTATYVLPFPIFQGYVDRITQVYGGPNDGSAQIDVSDMFKLLQRVELPTSVYAAEVASDGPTYWWRLGEPAGSTVALAAAGTPGTYEGAVTLGTAGGPVRDPDTALTLDGTTGLVSFGASPVITAFPYTVELWLKLAERTTTGNRSFFAQGRSGTTIAPHGWVTGTDLGDPGKIVFDGVTSTVRVDDGAWHHVVLKATAAGAAGEELFIDGVSQGTGTASALVGNEVVLGTPAYPAFSAISYAPWNGDLDELALYPTALSSARIQEHNAAGRVPWDGDTTGERLTRILDLAGIPTADRDVDAGSTTLQTTDLGGGGLAYAQKIEETELGRLYISADGAVTFRSRHNADTGTYLTSQATLVDADSGAGRGYRTTSADVDEATIVTRATVSREGSVAVTYQDDDAIEEFQIIDEVHDGLLHDDDAYSQAYAEWIVNTHKTPGTRVGAVTLELMADPDNMFPDILGLEIGDRVTYKRKPQNTGATFTQDMRVEAVSHAVGAKTWAATLQLTPFNLGEGGWGVGVWDTSLWDQAVWGV